MNRVASFNAGIDSTGRQQTLEFYIVQKNRRQVILERMRTGQNRVAYDVTWSKEQLNKLLAAVVDVKQEISKADRHRRILPDLETVDQDTRDRVIAEVINQTDQRDIQDLKRRRDVDMSAFKDEFDQFEYNKKGVEKVREQVLQMIYEQYGTDWFYSRSFLKEYRKRWEKGTARMWLRRLANKGYLRKQKVDEDDDPPGTTQYKYKIAKLSLDTIDKYGSFTSEDNPGWRRKKTLIDN